MLNRSLSPFLHDVPSFAFDPISAQGIVEDNAERFAAVLPLIAGTATP